MKSSGFSLEYIWSSNKHLDRKNYMHPSAHMKHTEGTPAFSALKQSGVHPADGAIVAAHDLSMRWLQSVKQILRHLATFSQQPDRLCVQ